MLTSVGVKLWIPEFQFPNDVNLKETKHCPCPRCGFKGKVISDGYTSPHRVMGKHYTYFLIGRKYLCKTCESKPTVKGVVPSPKYFTSFDPDVVCQLSKYIILEFNLVRTSTNNNASFIEDSIQEELSQHIFSGGSFSSYKKILETCHSSYWLR
mgnify:CR=1 FL=1